MPSSRFSGLYVSRRMLILTLVAAGVLGSMAFYRTHAAAPAPVTQYGNAAPPLAKSDVAPILALDKARELVASKVTPAVVNIAVTAKVKSKASPFFGGEQGPFSQFFGPFGPFSQQQQQPQIEHGIGSGFIISSNGYIVTNNHVVKGATNVSVTLHDKRVFPGRVVGTDPLTDLAVVKINATGLPTVSWGDSTGLKAGESVIAVGNPFGFSFTVTHGIISALNVPAQQGLSHRGSYIQTDAPINPGNSGGPLVNALGQVIGINTAIYTPSGAFAGIGLAIPSQIAIPTINDLIAHGKVVRGYLGIIISDIPPTEAPFLHLSKAEGAVVSQVTPGSPAAKAGVKVYDVIVGFNGQSIKNSGELQLLTGEQAPGARVTLKVMRNGQPLTLHATLAALPESGTAATPAAPAEHKGVRLGISVTDLTSQLRDQLQVPANVTGVVITDVQPGGPADNAGLSRGMVISGVDQHPISNVDELDQQLSAIPKGQSVLLLVYAQGANMLVVVQPVQSPAPPSH